MKELIRVRVQYASRQQCCKTHKRPLPFYYLCRQLLLVQRPSLTWIEKEMCLFKVGTLSVRSQTFIQKFWYCMREEVGKEIYPHRKHICVWEMALLEAMFLASVVTVNCCLVKEHRIYIQPTLFFESRLVMNLKTPQPLLVQLQTGPHPTQSFLCSVE